MFRILPLTKERLEEAVKLADDIFPSEYEEEPAKTEIPASLSPDNYRDFFLKTGILPSLRYWVAIDEDDKVVGIVGLYRYEADEEAEWLGWYLVAPSARKQGVGTELLQFAAKEARKQGRKFLRLYSTTDPNSFDAHRLFKGFGFRLIEEEAWEPDPRFTKLIFELNLKAQT